MAHLQRDAAMRALRESEEQLVQSNQALTALNERLNQFVGMAAHDIRSPLTAVLGFSKYLVRVADETLPERQRRMLESIHSSSEFVLRLVDNLLDVSRIEAGELHLERKPTDLAKLVQENVEMNRLLAGEKGTRIELHSEDPLPPVELDPDKIEQVLNNLISNAIKFSPAGATVAVGLDQTGDEVVISVLDQGPGIPDGELDRLFRPFGRTSVRPTGGEKSTGLGLAIAKQVVVRHGGRIWVEAGAGAGAGSQFFVSLPLTSAAASDG